MALGNTALGWGVEFLWNGHRDGWMGVGVEFSGRITVLSSFVDF